MPRKTNSPAKRRKYGYAHQKLRKTWAARIDQGDVACARCHRLILPGSKWHLGHSDVDRTSYTGPEHARCNNATNTRGRATYIRQQITKQRKAQMRWNSQAWE